LRAKGDCEARYGGFCDANGHDTDDLLVWRPDSPVQGGALSA
jgi:glycine cleavage system aminomethyltransferase T